MFGRSITVLPQDVVLDILRHLSPYELLTVAPTNKLLRGLCRHSTLWEAVAEQLLPGSIYRRVTEDADAYHAVKHLLTRAIFLSDSPSCLPFDVPTELHCRSLVEALGLLTGRDAAVVFVGQVNVAAEVDPSEVLRVVATPPFVIGVQRNAGKDLLVPDSPMDLYPSIANDIVLEDCCTTIAGIQFRRLVVEGGCVRLDTCRATGITGTDCEALHLRLVECGPHTLVVHGGTGTVAHSTCTGGVSLYNTDIHFACTTITGSPYAGVLIRGTSCRPTLFDCEVHSNHCSNIAVCDGAAPTVRQCRIHSCLSEAGVFVYDEARPTIEGCWIYGNDGPNVAVESGASPTVKNCDIRDSANAGILISDGGRGVFVENSIVNNKKSNVAVYGACGEECRVTDNIISGAGGNGITVSDGACLLIARNRVEDATVSNVDVSGSGTNPNIVANRISRSRGTGLQVYSSAAPSVTANDIELSCGPNVTISAASPVVSCNDVQSGVDAGFLIREPGCHALIQSNTVHSHRGPNIAVARHAKPSVTGNCIFAGESGVLYTGSGGGELTGNVLWSNQNGDVVVEEDGDPDNNVQLNSFVDPAAQKAVELLGSIQEGRDAAIATLDGRLLPPPR